MINTEVTAMSSGKPERVDLLDGEMLSTGNPIIRGKITVCLSSRTVALSSNRDRKQLIVDRRDK